MATHKLIDLGKDGSKWKHGYIPENPAAVALKMHRKPGSAPSSGESPSFHHGQHVEFTSLAGDKHHGTVQGRSNGNAVSIRHGDNIHAVGIKESKVRPLGVHELTHEELRQAVKTGANAENLQDIGVAQKRSHITPEQAKLRAEAAGKQRAFGKAASDEIVRRSKEPTANSDSAKRDAARAVTAAHQNQTLKEGDRVRSEFGHGKIIASTDRTVTVQLDDAAGTKLNIVKGTPGYGRLRPDVPLDSDPRRSSAQGAEVAHQKLADAIKANGVTGTVGNMTDVSALRAAHAAKVKKKDKKLARPTHALVDLSKLTAAKRKKLKPSQFAVSGGRYPIPDESHARNALARAAGKPEEKIVKAAVRRKFPQIKVS